MSTRWTRQNATVCAQQMKLDGYEPGTILNIGLGSMPEMSVWLKRYPAVKIVGADLRCRQRGQPPNVTFTKTLVGNGSNVSFCRLCHSCKCTKQNHAATRLVMPTITVDKLAADSPPPYFLWIDVEGAELDVLRSATKTLEQTRWINVEVQNYGDMKNHPKNIHDWMVEHEYVLVLKQARTTDRLYRKVF